MNELTTTLRDALSRHVSTTFLVATGVGLLLLMDPGGMDAPAYVHATPTLVAPQQLSQLGDVVVSAGQKVSQGQLLATLDVTSLKLSRSVLQKELVVLETQGRLDEHSFGVQRRQMQMDLVKEKTLLWEGTAALAGLERQLNALKQSEQLGLVGSAEVLQVQWQVDSRRAEVQGLQDSVDAMQGAHAHWMAMPEDEHGAVGLAASQIEVLRTRIEELQHQIDSSAIESPLDGRVAVVHQAAGATVGPATPLFELLPESANTVVACVGEEHAVSLTVGDLAEVRTSRGSALPAMVTSIASLVAPSDPRCRGTMHDERWVRPIYLVLDAEQGLPVGSQLRAFFDTEKAPVTVLAERVAELW